jgi:hypothetical protein
MVNTYDHLQNSEVVLLLNLDTHLVQRSDVLQEYILRVAATLLHQAQQLGIVTQLAINATGKENDTPLISSRGTGWEHYQELLRMISRLDISATLTDYAAFLEGADSLLSPNRRNTTYLLLSNYRKPWLQELYQKKKSQGYALTWICPEYKEYISYEQEILFWEVKSNEI